MSQIHNAHKHLKSQSYHALEISYGTQSFPTQERKKCFYLIIYPLCAILGGIFYCSGYKKITS